MPNKHNKQNGYLFRAYLQPVDDLEFIIKMQINNFAQRVKDDHISNIVKFYLIFFEDRTPINVIIDKEVSLIAMNLLQ